MTVSPALRDVDRLLARIRGIHEAIRDRVVASCETRSGDELAAVVGDDAGDTLFAIDRVSEEVLVAEFEALARDWPLLLVAEGLGQDGRLVLPRDTQPNDVEIVVLVDPIDGTRGLMYQKRSAWVLTGVAPFRPQGSMLAATLADIELAVQTEIPLVKQHLCDVLWAVAAGGAHSERLNRLTGERRPLRLGPSRAQTIAQGYGGLARFFPGARAELAAIDDAVVARVLGAGQKGRARSFEDQYISSGGQLYELMVGHDRWIADLRPLVEPLLRARHEALGLCAHPYDLATELIAREAGVIVTDGAGERLRAPLDVFSEIAWIGYANEAIRAQVEPALREALREQGLAPSIIREPGEGSRTLLAPPPMPWRLEGEAPASGSELARAVSWIASRAEFFDPRRPLVLARAPGRLDLMGGIADYSGSLVLELPLAVATFVAAQATDGAEIVVESALTGDPDVEARATFALAELAAGEMPLHTAAARALFARDPRRAWSAYVLGALVILHREHGVRPRGMRLLVRSDVPPGKGVSSSAALEIAALEAIAALQGLALDGRSLALLAQKVENFIVGAPCGVMDQLTSACGQADHLVEILCQPAELLGHLPLPPTIEVFGIDSGVRHAVSGADYASVRVAAFMGYRMIAAAAGLTARSVGAGRVAVDDPIFGGHLANVTPSLWRGRFRALIPELTDGARFLAEFQGTTDPATRVDPTRSYRVRAATEHPIEEHQRVRLFREILAGGAASEESRTVLGELMYESHASTSACGLGAAETDRLVELVRAAGPAAGLHGAKITGGGSGGTVAVLARRGSRAAVDAIAARYGQETGRAPVVFAGSSPGAHAFGVRRFAVAP